NGGDFAERRPIVLVDHHHPILPPDKQTMIWWIGHDVVPAAVSAQRVGVSDAVGRGCLPDKWRRGGQRQDERDGTHHGSFCRESIRPSVDARPEIPFRTVSLRRPSRT